MALDIMLSYNRSKHCVKAVVERAIIGGFEQVAEHMVKFYSGSSEVVIMRPCTLIVM